MKVFVTGATGAIGRPLVSRLVDAGHEVVGATRSAERARALGEQGATGVVADALDAAAIGEAVAAAEPEVVIHQATSIASFSPKKLDRDFAVTNRLRTEGTDNLLAAARACGARRLIAQSYGGWPYAREGARVKDEDQPLDPNPPKEARATHAAINRLENTVAGAEGIEGVVLRYGGFYGPGTSMTTGGAQFEAVRKRRLPIVGNGDGVWSFVHVDDAAAATVAALENGSRGIYNVCDDDPAPCKEWIPELAEILGAKPPRRVPVWLGRLAAGELGVAMIDQIRGCSNAKARSQLSWAPKRATWRDGFREEAAA
jgi:nucleoside-diphosphate-sugar epimerase